MNLRTKPRTVRGFHWIGRAEDLASVASLLGCALRQNDHGGKERTYIIHPDDTRGMIRGVYYHQTGELRVAGQSVGAGHWIVVDPLEAETQVFTSGGFAFRFDVG